MSEYKTFCIASGKIVCGGSLSPARDSKGMLLCPPHLAVFVYDEERDCLALGSISWKAAEQLAPDDMKEIVKRLNEARDEAWSKKVAA